VQGDLIRDAISTAIRINNAGHLGALLTLADYGSDRDWVIAEAARNRRTHMVAMLAERGWFPSRLPADETERLEAMAACLQRGSEVFRPSNFWTTFNGFARQHLEMMGLENFKRSINQMYCNFIPQDLHDPQLRHLRAHGRGRGDRASVSFRLENPDDDPGLWFTQYEPLKFFQGDARHRRRLYLLLISRLYRYLEDAGLSADAESLEEPTLGNPIRVWRGDNLVSQDLATSIDEFAFLDRWSGALGSSSRPAVAEFGAGYGRLAYVFLKKTRCRYFIFDIPPALRISEWYLTNLFPDRRIFAFRDFDRFDDVAAEIEASDIAFFTANQVALFPDKFFDMFLNISSLHEMKKEHAAVYLDLMGEKTKSHIFIKQYYEYMNPYDKITITRQDYDFPEQWRPIREEASGLNPRFFQILFELA
jgi:putative sugar O-methyltransferase